MSEQNQVTTEAPAPAPTAATVESLSGVDESTLLAELESLETDDEGYVEAKETEDEGEPSEAVEDEDGADESDGETEAEGDDDETEEEEEEAEEEEAEEEDGAEIEDDADDSPVDEATQKKLDKLMEAASRNKENAERERQAILDEKREWRQEQEQHKELIERARQADAAVRNILTDPVGKLLDLGLAPEDLEQLSRDAWAAHKAEQGDPEFRDQRRNRSQQSQYRNELEAQKQETARLASIIERQNQESSVNEYLDTAAKAVSDETPIVARWLKSDATEARFQMRLMAKHILDETGETPDPGDVVKELERAQQAKLEKLGIDVEAVKKTTSKKKKTPARAGQKKAAKSLSTKSTTSTKKPPERVVRTLDEEAEDVLRALESGVLD